MTLIYMIISAVIALLLVTSRTNYFHDNNIVALRLKREILMCLILVGLSYTATELRKNKANNFSEFEIGSLHQTKVDQINSFDRVIAGRWDLQAKSNGKILKNIAIYVIPISLLFFAGGIKRRLVLFFIFSQGYVLTESLTSISKGIVNRYRPFAYRSSDEIEQLNINAKESFLEDIASYDILNSFFSGDASIIAFGLVFFAYSYSLFYKESKYKKVVWMMAVIGVVLGCYFRALSGKHFPTDVLMGGLVGLLVALGILIMHKKGVKPIDLNGEH